MGYDQDSVVQVTQKGRTFGKRRWKGPECNNLIRNRDFKEKQHLRRSERISSGIYRKTWTGVHEASNRDVQRLWKVRNWTFWRGQPPLE
jgi:hypothetical protein